jgi:hypothetical protein
MATRTRRHRRQRGQPTQPDEGRNVHPAAIMVAFRGVSYGSRESVPRRWLPGPRLTEPVRIRPVLDSRGPAALHLAWSPAGTGAGR